MIINTIPVPLCQHIIYYINASFVIFEKYLYCVPFNSCNKHLTSYNCSMIRDTIEIHNPPATFHCHHLKVLHLAVHL